MIWFLWGISNWTFLHNGGRTKKSQFLCPSKVLGLRSFRIIYNMMSRNKWELSAEGKVKHTTICTIGLVYFCWTCIGGMEKSHLITVATLTQVSYPYPEINEHENISDADVKNTILLCSAFHTVPWFLYSSA